MINITSQLTCFLFSHSPKSHGQVSQVSFRNSRQTVRSSPKFCRTLSKVNGNISFVFLVIIFQISPKEPKPRFQNLVWDEERVLQDS